ncbi:MAG: NAD-dependent epimerase/dehydratase family protein [Endomicrobia bacterium]|nr:NAD-dependent epimerase/dehydratase family protein [Endomicrobiia bacterium]
MKILVTGVAGFIGFHLAKKLLEDGYEVVGIDNINDYYDVKLKLDRLKKIEHYKNFKFIRIDLKNTKDVFNLFNKGNFDYILHMAAQAGVRYSLQNPYQYVDSNIYSLVNILEATKNLEIKHFVFASSSSVYGANKKVPFSEEDKVDTPVSLYAATKKSGELIAHCYSWLYGIKTTALRFFTVYGPWGRPDMSYFIFSKNIVEAKPIDVYNNGKMKRDFTYIDDVVEAVILITTTSPRIESLEDNREFYNKKAPFRVYNIGNNNPVELLKFIELLEEYLGKKAIKKFLPLQKGDVVETYADISSLRSDFGFVPKTPIEVGLKKFVEWFKEYYNVLI